MRTSREWLVEDDKSFWIQDDVKLRSLGELATALAFMPSEIYHHFVSDDKNDFAGWVAGSFGEPELAESMRSNSNQDAVRHLILQTID